MSKLSSCVGAILVTALISGASGTAVAETNIKIATLAPKGSPWMVVLDKAAAEIAEKTSNRVTLKYFEGGQQGDERDAVRKVEGGQIDGAAVTSIGLSMIDESIRVLELPRMFATAEEVDYVADRMWPYFQQKFDKKGWKLNDRGEVGWIHFIAKEPIATMADIKKIPIWQWGDDKIVKTMFAKLGLKGVPLGVPEVDPSLTSGRIKAAYGSPVAAVALQWYSKVKYMSSMPMSFGIGATVVRTKTLEKLSAEDRKTVEEIGKSAAKKLRKTIRKSNEEAKTTMMRKGVQLVETSAEVVKAFDDAAKSVWDELAAAGVYTKAELAMVIKYRDEYRAKTKK
ncbi:MAG: TRAP transporter substrate-binding protein DctP [Deltaproteobacteria bacterium]|nr:TRAP transporter substrate-binding protein DctP [Deltaproteobacteria bacterium]